MNDPSTGTSADDDGGGSDDGEGRSRAVRVLVVDDNDLLRGLLSRILRAEGFTTSEAASVEEALGLDPGAHDAIVVDVRLEGRPGTDLVAELRRTTPALVRRCLLLTGAPGLDELPPDVPMVAKPFTADQIVREVRRLLPTAATERG
ncbi:response regulator [Frankia sp. Ag45/Mut15]|uniref:Response regulator n=1 Tax=Frankia umida TaxID=573489 RepID=A0ABT0JW05_9ACTN|nr:response regulator [Frankia umida]MCK9875661.1 response regulator [Frankia umida]